ncbi:hypothetical protein [Microbulbifer sp. GL-2]|uniref:hypothetical protein n=1 Tax=Microbulbifer sp. GL-2 TaxID=2591606 RepID=UPI0011655296|nr:hypothetical protein [Microbulbifer sp. GL-2]BBM03953.1 hypothetical protein GL2_40270 [Microbulbifer sp. GL-2]
MTPRQFYYTYPKERVKQVAKQAGTTFANFKQIAVARGAVGRGLAERLCKASDGMISELESLYPERYEKPVNVQQAS